jgi:hypothetical protein
VRKRAFRYVATLVADQGPCTRTDETIDFEVVYNGSWLLTAVDNKCSSYPILSELNLFKFC